MALEFIDPKARTGFIVSGGGAISDTDLQFNGPVEAGQSFHASALVSLNANKRIEAGLCEPTAMPMFAVNGNNDLDAGQFGYNLRKASDPVSDATINALPATGGFELACTEYNVAPGEFAESDYAPNTVLTNDVSVPGQIEPAPAAYSTVTVVGIVSTGVQSNVTEGLGLARRRLNQKALMHFWTHFQLPVNLGS